MRLCKGRGDHLNANLHRHHHHHDYNHRHEALQIDCKRLKASAGSRKEKFTLA